MKLALGCDHGGYDLMQHVKKYLDDQKIEYIDYGCHGERCDYPDYAKKVADAILTGEVDYGILMCGTGIGISIAANKIPGIRCALCSDCYSAKMTRQHNDANAIAMGGRVVGPDLAEMIVETFLNTPFSEGERHIRRIEEMDPTYSK